MTALNDTSSLIHRVSDAARQDPRKTAALGLLLLVLIIMLCRVLMTGNTQPARAGGATVTSAQAEGTSGSVLNSSRSAGRSDASDRQSDLDSAGARLSRTHNSAQRMREWMTDPVKPLSRNLFAVKLDYFPIDGTRAPQGIKTAADGEFWGKLEKSLMLQADQRDKRENLLANFQAEAGNLRLDSIMMGPSPKAMINGKLLAEGDVVASFRVLKIEPRRIVVEREGIRLEILMK